MAGPYNVILPISGQPVSSSLFGVRVKTAIDDLDARANQLEAITEDIILVCKLAVQPSPVQPIPDAVDTLVNFGAGSEEFDTGNWHSESIDNSRVTVDRNGFYQVTAMLTYAFNTSFLYGDMAIRKNGTVLYRSGNLAPTTTNNVSKTSGSLNELIKADAGDYIQMSALQNSTGDVAQNLNTGSAGTRLTVRYVGPYA